VAYKYFKINGLLFYNIFTSTFDSFFYWICSCFLLTVQSLSALFLIIHFCIPLHSISRYLIIITTLVSYVPNCHTADQYYCFHDSRLTCFYRLVENVHTPLFVPSPEHRYFKIWYDLVINTLKCRYSLLLYWNKCVAD